MIKEFKERSDVSLLFCEPFSLDVFLAAFGSSTPSKQHYYLVVSMKYSFQFTRFDQILQLEGCAFSACLNVFPRLWLVKNHLPKDLTPLDLTPVMERGNWSQESKHFLFEAQYSLLHLEKNC